MVCCISKVKSTVLAVTTHFLPDVFSCLIALEVKQNFGSCKVQSVVFFGGNCVTKTMIIFFWVFCVNSFSGDRSIYTGCPDTIGQQTSYFIIKTSGEKWHTWNKLNKCTFILKNVLIKGVCGNDINGLQSFFQVEGKILYTYNFTEILSSCCATNLNLLL